MNIKILEAEVEFIEQPFSKPLQLSSGLITQATEARTKVTVSCGSSVAIGRGSIFLSDLWAWPGLPETRSRKDMAMRTLCRHIAQSLGDWCGGEDHHPLELGLRLHHNISTYQTDEMPLLARALCSSPFDAAIHDAAGNALHRSAFAFYEDSVDLPSADQWFPTRGACTAIKETLRPPVQALDAWWVVSATDDLERSARPAVTKGGIRCFKIKVLGRDSQEDAARTSEVFRFARSCGILPKLSIDSNEGNPHADSVVEYLDQLRTMDREAFDALGYIEQPTSRDILQYPQNWSTVAQSKPVMLDEGLTSLEILPVVKEQGWSGIALKTCKGHSFSLVSAAWAKQEGLQVCLQDLTNPGYSAIHSYLLGAHLETINGIELNSPQLTPAANLPWLPRLSSIFEPSKGYHRLAQTNTPGLGSTL